LVERLKKVFEETLSATYEIVLVDDGSKSAETWKVVQDLASTHETVRGIRLSRNFGKPSAVLCGLGVAKGDWIITIDDDLQQRPEDIPTLVEYEDHDVVVANFAKRHHGRVTRFTSWIKSQFDRVILGLPCKMSPLKLFRAEIAQGMLQIRTPRPFIPALMASVTNDFYPVVVPHDGSRHGPSRYSIRRRLRQFSNLLIGNSNLLLRWFAILGAIVAVSGFIFGTYIIIRKISGDPLLPGWTSLVVINLFFGGLILIALGIIGEYLIRILEGSTLTPPYVVREVVGEPRSKATSRTGQRTDRLQS
jgi:glycosyltransferase involved in cell wall biosynthesis